MRAAPGEMPAPFRGLIAAFAVTAALTLFIGARVTHQGQWLPSPPGEFGAWSPTEMPLDDGTLAQLGYPKTAGVRYTNPFSEHVDAHVIAAASIDAYHEPAICMAGYGFTVTAQKYLPLFGKNGMVRALILQNRLARQRILLYYWVQDQHGETSTDSSFRAYQDYLRRMGLGLSATLNGNQRCIVRAYTMIDPADPNGRQARRNLTEVAQAIYQTLRRDHGRLATGQSAAETPSTEREQP